MIFIRQLLSTAGIARSWPRAWQTLTLSGRRGFHRIAGGPDRDSDRRGAGGMLPLCGLSIMSLVAACDSAGNIGSAGVTTATVAVATNFHRAAGELELMFEAATGHELTLVSGSTGKLYAQIENGAPFDVLLAADVERPRRLEAADHAVRGTRFVYATGQLSLWSPDPAALQEDGRTVLERADFEHLAIANPELAPYGLAARQVLQNLGLWDGLAPRIVMGENIGQAHALVATGNAALGFVARASLQQGATGSSWLVPADLHEPIRQEAVLLRRGEHNTAARAFLEFLRGDAARARIAAYGYGTD
ncbi:MAG: molybdate ABC transporter substrate-binding protein [Woeseiaceae bacterium]|nr:molybdate ABC transporter substrate-binding protein [Woeseiaceae bacterium]